ncbi:MAG: hypothetical protein HN568_08335 [Phycisphaerae bacterium]|nr:hypothetical protein [Phycisphaerae bacterium]
MKITILVRGRDIGGLSRTDIFIGSWLDNVGENSASAYASDGWVGAGNIAALSTDWSHCEFSSTPTPGALALLAIAGVTRKRLEQPKNELYKKNSLLSFLSEGLFFYLNCNFYFKSLPS